MIQLVRLPKQLTQKDATTLNALDVECFPGDDPYPKRASGTVWWTLVDGAEPVAFAGARVMRSDGVVFLCRCGVRAGYRGRRLQRRLIRARTRLARSLGLVAVTYTAIDNVPSSNNLIRCGFQLWEPANPWAGRRVLYWRKA